jgi:RecA/RadA recombinase
MTPVPKKSSGKIDFKELSEKIKKTIKDPEKARSISTGADMYTPSKPEDFVVGPKWWQEGAQTLGIPFGFVVMVSGNTDSGKTSATIEFMREAQKQGVKVILADTEKKTTKSRLQSWGVNPDELALVQPTSLEEMYDGIWMWWMAIKDADPEARILVIIDNLGNTPSWKEGETNLEDSMQMGLAAKINKRAFRRMVPRLGRDKVAFLVINYTYANMGSPGMTNAGGKAVDFFSCLTFQTSRKQWLEKKQGGHTLRIGARVQWRLYKNHLLEAGKTVRKELVMDITADGMRVVGAETTADEDSGDE